MSERSAYYTVSLGACLHIQPSCTLFLPRETLVPTFSCSSCFSLLASSSWAWRSFICAKSREAWEKGVSIDMGCPGNTNPNSPHARYGAGARSQDKGRAALLEEDHGDGACGEGRGGAPEPRPPCASSSARSCPPDPPPAGSGSHSSHAEGGSAAPPAGRRQDQSEGIRPRVPNGTWWQVSTSPRCLQWEGGDDAARPARGAGSRPRGAQGVQERLSSQHRRTLG